MPIETKALYEFGKFRCDPGEHLLLCAGKPVSLAPKAFEILVVLVQSNGRLLTKDELMQQVWPDSFVEEANLTVNISSLRKVLGESAEGQRYIETVPKLGYRFVAPVTERQGNDKADTPMAAASAVAGTATPAVPRSRSHLWRRAVAAALLLTAALVVFLVFRRPAKLTDKDTIVLADFTNLTGDTVFDDALRQGLSSQLEQSPFLNLLSDDRIAQTLSLMAKPRDSRLTPDLALEVCRRTGSAAALDGSIAQVGSKYLLTLKVIDCANGDSLVSAAEQAADKNHILDALGAAASKVRSQLGESLASVQKYDAPAENVTTASLEALKAYSLGYQAMIVRSDFSAAIELLQRAIRLDPNFAMAHARLGTSYSNLNETVLAAESVRKAYALRDRVSERERLYIASHYELFVTGNLEAARKVYELSAQTFPRLAPLNNLGLIHSELGDFDKALAACQNVLQVSPGTGNRYANLVNAYLQLNRLDEARAAAREAQAHNVDSPEIHLHLYWVAFLQHDAAAMEREKLGMMSKSGYDNQMLNHEADTALYRGQLAQARMLTQRAVETAWRDDEKEASAIYQASGAVREALAGNWDLARQQAHTALQFSAARDVEALAAIALEMAGDSSRATHLASDLAKRFPEDTLVQSNYLPAIRAAALLRGGASPQAVEALAVAPYEFGGNLETLTFVLYPVYLRGGAYLAAKQGPAAAAEFQKILARPGVVRSEPIGALAHLGLARAYVLSRNLVDARHCYDDFFSLWKDADPDIPLLKDAKAEYAKLK